MHLTDKSTHLEPGLHTDSNDDVTALRQRQMSVEPLEQPLQSRVEPLAGPREENPVNLAVEPRNSFQFYLPLNCSVLDGNNCVSLFSFPAPK